MNEKVARDLNLVVVDGRLGNTPELNKTVNGLSSVEFRIANNRDYKSNGEVVKRVNWITCKAYGGLAETICSYLVKGAKANFVGELRTDSWQEDDGSMRSRTYLLVTEMNFLEAKKSDTSTSTSTQKTNNDKQNNYDYSNYDDYNF